MLGEALRLIRVFNDCKTSALAGELDISASYISEIESGKKTPSLEILNKYADYFDTTVSAIMFFSEDLAKDKARPVKAAARKKLIKFLQIIENVTAN
jgi:transcriptional regulator with XRE-family HTH domain